MKKYFFLIFVLIFIYIVTNSCQDNPSSPLEKNKYTNVITGNVVLGNQQEHSNALVYLDSLNRGVSSDSNGNYKILFNEEDSAYNGEFKIRYFLNDYDMDSAKIMLVKGKVKLDTLDVDSEGKIQTKEMKQIVRVEGWTDKQEYKIGEKITFTAQFTNVTDRIVTIYIQAQSELGYVGLYNDKYPSFILSPCDPYPAGGDLYIQPNHYYEGKVEYKIRDGDYCGNFRPLEIDDYIIAGSFTIEGRLQNQFQSKFSKYVLEEWYKMHRGISPKLDWFPNKYQFPHIRIIQ